MYKTTHKTLSLNPPTLHPLLPPPKPPFCNLAVLSNLPILYTFIFVSLSQSFSTSPVSILSFFYSSLLSFTLTLISISSVNVKDRKFPVKQFFTFSNEEDSSQTENRRIAPEKKDM